MHRFLHQAIAVAFAAIVFAAPAVADDRSDCGGKDYDKVIAGCSAIIKAGSDSKIILADAHLNRGNVYMAKLDFERALSDYDQAIRLNANSVPAYISRGYSFLRIGERERARADLDQAVRISPKDRDNPTSAVAYFRRTNFFIEVQEFENALADIDRALAVGGGIGLALAYRAATYALMGKLDLALAEADRSTKVQPKMSGPYITRGFVYLEQGQLARAKDELDHALSLDSRNGNTFFHRARVMEAIDDARAAIADYGKALEFQLSLRLGRAEIARGKIAEFERKLRSTAVEDGSQEQSKQVAGLEGKQAIATSGKRLALVIGNGAYKYSDRLPNPRNDGQAMSAALAKMGFEVVDGYDLDKGAMEATIRDFARKAAAADVALFFYAGHGMQVGARNYLIPTDAKLEEATAVDFELVDVDQTIVKYMGGESKVGIVLLDACRNNPLARSFARSFGVTRSGSVGNGLAAMSGEGGLLIAFATAPGDVAADGSGINSPFTAALLKHLPTPGMEIEQILKRVKNEVYQATGRQQQPWHNSALRTDVFLVGDTQQ